MVGSGFGSGAQASLRMAWEPSFGTTATDTDYKAFGRDETISISVRENMEKLYAYNQRGVNIVVPKQFEGTADIEFTMEVPYFLYGLLGAHLYDGIPTPHTHTFTENAGVISMEVQVGLKMLGEDEKLTLNGVVINTATITAAVNELVRVRLSCFVKSVTTTPGTVTHTTIPAGFSPYVFQHGTLTADDSYAPRTNFGVVQRFELTIANNTLTQYGLGTRAPQRALQQAFDIDARLTVLMEDSSLLDAVLLATEETGFDLILNNGLAAAAEREIKIEGGAYYFDEHSPTLTPNEPLVEDMPMIVKTIQVVAKDDDDDSKYSTT